MKFFKLLFLSTILVTQLKAQQTKLYKGPVNDDQVEYYYYENVNYERVYHGSWKATTSAYVAKGNALNDTLNGSYSINATNKYFKMILGTAAIINIDIRGNFKKGKLDGEWFYNSQRKGADGNTFFEQEKSTAEFKDGFLDGNYYYLSKSDYGKFEINGKFNNGLQDGKWTSKGDKIEVIEEYANGILKFRLERNHQTGEVIEKYDKRNFVDSLINTYSNGVSLAGNYKYSFDTTIIEINDDLPSNSVFTVWAGRSTEFQQLLNPLYYRFGYFFLPKMKVVKPVRTTGSDTYTRMSYCLSSLKAMDKSLKEGRTLDAIKFYSLAVVMDSNRVKNNKIGQFNEYIEQITTLNDNDFLRAIDNIKDNVGFGKNQFSMSLNENELVDIDFVNTTKTNLGDLSSNYQYYFRINRTLLERTNEETLSVKVDHILKQNWGNKLVKRYLSIYEETINKADEFYETQKFNESLKCYNKADELDKNCPFKYKFDFATLNSKIRNTKQKLEDQVNKSEAFSESCKKLQFIHIVDDKRGIDIYVTKTLVSIDQFYSFYDGFKVSNWGKIDNKTVINLSLSGVRKVAPGIQTPVFGVTEYGFELYLDWLNARLPTKDEFEFISKKGSKFGLIDTPKNYCESFLENDVLTSDDCPSYNSAGDNIYRGVFRLIVDKDTYNKLYKNE